MKLIFSNVDVLTPSFILSFFNMSIPTGACSFKQVNTPTLEQITQISIERDCSLFNNMIGNVNRKSIMHYIDEIINLLIHPRGFHSFIQHEACCVRSCKLHNRWSVLLIIPITFESYPSNNQGFISFDNLTELLCYLRPLLSLKSTLYLYRDGYVRDADNKTLTQLKFINGAPDGDSDSDSDSDPLNNAETTCYIKESDSDPIAFYNEATCEITLALDNINYEHLATHIKTIHAEYMAKHTPTTTKALPTSPTVMDFSTTSQPNESTNLW